MNLVIDAGNTRIKWAIFDVKQQILKHGVNSHNEFLTFLEGLDGIENVVISDVSGKIEIKKISKYGKVVELTHALPVPISLDYETPETLGHDRIASAVGAHLLFPESNCLIIDAGTCITVDLITSSGVYQGGAIAPGIQMRLDAMHKFTGKLPQLTNSNTYNQLHGKSTKDCMLSGAITFSFIEIDAVIQRYTERYQTLRVILTGGDTELLAKGLKSNTFADLFLVEKGLNEILRFNL